MEGWIVLHRKITEWEWYKDTNTFKVFLHLLLTANIKPVKYMGFMLTRGELITTVKELSEETSLSKKQIRTAINHLKRTNEVAIKTTNKFTIVTIVNYGFYQDKPDSNNTPKGNQKGNQRAIKGQSKGNQRASIEEQEEQEEQINNINTLSVVPKIEQLKDDLCKTVIDYLNQKTGRKFRNNIPKTKTLILARHKEGFEYKDFCTVIDRKSKQWIGTEWEKFLRPETLFGTKFEGYLNESDNIKKDKPDKKNAFTNYSQRTYDFDEYEEQERERQKKYLADNPMTLEDFKKEREQHKKHLAD